MATADFSQTLVSDKSPEEVFNIVKDVRQWWSGVYDETIEGDTDVPGEEFTFHAGGGMHYSKQKLVELIPNKKLVWLVTDSKLTFLQEQSEWTGTKIIFDLSEKDGKTEVLFTHEGLLPQIECYEACSNGWTQYLEKRLKPLLGSK